MSPRYQLSRIPNDDEGRQFVETLKKFLNKERYSVRVRGQGLKSGENWRHHQYGAPLSKSTHLRIYIEEKQNVDL